MTAYKAASTGLTTSHKVKPNFLCGALYNTGGGKPENHSHPFSNPPPEKPPPPNFLPSQVLFIEAQFSHQRIYLATISMNFPGKFRPTAYCGVFMKTWNFPRDKVYADVAPISKGSKSNINSLFSTFPRLFWVEKSNFRDYILGSNRSTLQGLNKEWVVFSWYLATTLSSS